MLANIPSPKPRKTSPALEAILSNLEAPCDDLLSGSECSSLVASPIEEMSAFSLETRSPKIQYQESNLANSGSARPQPIELVLNFLENMMSETNAAEGFIFSDAIIECCGHSMSADRKTPTHLVHQSGLDKLKTRCSAHDLQIDSVFGQGGDVAVFGHFAQEARPMGVERTVNLVFGRKLMLRGGGLCGFGGWIRS